jgi:hypothetical protein
MMRLYAASWTNRKEAVLNEPPLFSIVYFGFFKKEAPMLPHGCFKEKR